MTNDRQRQSGVARCLAAGDFQRCKAASEGRQWRIFDRPAGKRPDPLRKRRHRTDPWSREANCVITYDQTGYRIRSEPALLWRRHQRAATSNMRASVGALAVMIGPFGFATR